MMAWNDSGSVYGLGLDYYYGQLGIRCSNRHWGERVQVPTKTNEILRRGRESGPLAWLHVDTRGPGQAKVTAAGHGHSVHALHGLFSHM